MDSLTTAGSTPQSARGFWTEHATNIRDVARRFSPWILLLPVALCAWIGTQSANPWWEYTLKPYQEVYGPAVLVLAVIAAVVVWWMQGGFYPRWLTLLSVCLLCREIHFRGTGTGIYIAIPLLMWYASAHIAEMKPYVDRRLLVTLFVGAFITYFFAITVDRAVWKFLPNHAHWRNNIEESLESLGHLMILGMIIASAFVKRTANRG